MTIKANATGTLDRILNPRRVAVVGVTSSGFGFGSGILASLISIGFEGELFPVNPKGGSIHGLDIHTSLESIPGEIDFAIIALPAHLGRCCGQSQNGQRLEISIERLRRGWLCLQPFLTSCSPLRAVETSSALPQRSCLNTAN